MLASANAVVVLKNREMTWSSESEDDGNEYLRFGREITYSLSKSKRSTWKFICLSAVESSLHVALISFRNLHT